MQPRSLPKSSHFNQDARPEVADFEDERNPFEPGDDERRSSSKHMRGRSINDLDLPLADTDKNGPDGE